MTYNDEYVQTNLENARVPEHIRSEVRGLLDRIGDVSYDDLHRIIDIFGKLAKSENLPNVEAVAAAAARSGLRPWQEFIFNRIHPETIRKMPAYARNQSAMWRFSSSDHFASDVIHCCGPIASATLSMVYQPKTIVEMGCHGGMTTLLLCKMNYDAMVHGVDVNSLAVGTDLPVGYAAWYNGVNNLTMHLGNSWELAMPGQVDLCFIDADHCGDAPWKDTLRAWDNRNASGDWCIAWDDYHENNPDVFNAVNRFVEQVGMPLQKVASWVFIGTKSQGEVERLF